MKGNEITKKDIVQWQKDGWFPVCCRLCGRVMLYPKTYNQNDPNYFHRLDKEFYKFHDLHRQKGNKIKPDTTPTCTKYVPSKKLVWRKTINVFLGYFVCIFKFM